MFQSRYKYSKHVVNASTALYSQRVTKSKKNNNMRQVSGTERLSDYLHFTPSHREGRRPENVVPLIFQDLEKVCIENQFCLEIV